ncbi:MAG: restriction endonuclease subunit S [Thermodesulfobacteriota bacterium]|nr:restriction endonuclease subunit S [Thermodesulfobacteriota bacterium]
MPAKPSRTGGAAIFLPFRLRRAKAEGRDPGLPEEIADLFPGSFQDSELGQIPKGWETKTIGEMVEFAYGKAMKASDRKPGSVTVFGSNGPVGSHNESLVKGPGIVIGRKGNPGIVTWSSKDFFPIDTTFYVKNIGNISSLIYLFYALKGQDLPSLAADSAVPGLNRNMAYMNNILVPSDKVLSAFDEQIEPLFQKIDANDNESLALATLRDTLLPKLISGELRVPDAEKFVEEAGV